MRPPKISIDAPERTQAVASASVVAGNRDMPLGETQSKIALPEPVSNAVVQSLELSDTCTL